MNIKQSTWMKGISDRPMNRKIKLPPEVKDTPSFNSWLGNPIHPKLHRETPFFPFQEKVARDIKEFKHVIINKFTGAGMTEIIPRIALELGIRERQFFKQIAIVTGTRMNFTEQVIKSRIKPVIDKKNKGIIKEYIKARIELINGIYIQGYPTDHIDTIRGQDDIFFIFIDEAAFFHPNLQEDLNMAIERYIIKTDPYIVWNSTPNGPEGVFYNKWIDSISLKNDYKNITIPYTEGLSSSLITTEQIEKAMKENPRLWRQEYDNQFIAPMGAVTEQPMIDMEQKEERFV